MSQDLIAGKRLPRGMRRSENITSGEKRGGGKRFRSYFDLSKVGQNCTPEEYRKKVEEVRRNAQLG